MMKMNIQGVGVALITPFADDGTVDFSALERVVEHVIAGGVDYLVVLGTTGETATLSVAEKAAVAQCVTRVNAGRLPMVIGIGGNDTAGVEEQIRAFDASGFVALLSVTPYYNKPSQEGLYQHYMRLQNVSPLPVILYNVPGRTGVNMTAGTTLRLARDGKNIAAIKEAAGDLSQVAYLLRDRPEGFLVISGDDNATLPMMVMGAEGVISVAANAFPKTFTEMARLASGGDYAGAGRHHLRMMEAVDALFAEGNPVGVKAALARLGLIRNNLRLPLVPSTPKLDERLAGLMERYGLN